jgi:4-hydroxy-2-oxoglutarate aldolase
MLDVSGLYPPIPTPFKADGSVDYAHLESNVRAASQRAARFTLATGVARRRLALTLLPCEATFHLTRTCLLPHCSQIKKWGDYALAGLVVQGSNGESVLMSEQERVDIIRCARRAMGPSRILIAGSGQEGTIQTIKMTQAMAAAGADVALVVAPGYFNAKTDALIAHYNAVADASPIPILVYNMPACTGIDMGPDVLVPCSYHPNIIGMKDSGGNVAKLTGVIHATRKLGNEFQVLAGSASFLLPMLMLGGVGGVCALANVAPQQLLHMMSLFKKGDIEGAAAIQRAMVKPNSAITKMFGVPGLKATLAAQGFYGGPVRQPLMELTAAKKKALFAILAEEGVLPKSRL